MLDIANAAPASVVLVHGGFVDGSGWEDVYRLAAPLTSSSSGSDGATSITSRAGDLLFGAVANARNR
jgi:hypothetical protein